MDTMTCSERENPDVASLTGFLVQHANTASKLGVLLFWSRHPETKFTVDCIDLAVQTQKQDVREGLESLVAEGVVRKEQTPTGLTVYCLSDEPQMKAPVVQLGKQTQAARCASVRPARASQPLTGLAQ